MSALARLLVAIALVIITAMTMGCGSAPSHDAGVCLPSTPSSLACQSGRRLVCGNGTGQSVELTVNERCEFTTDSLNSPVRIEANGEMRQCDLVIGHVCYWAGDSIAFTTGSLSWGCRSATNLIVDGGEPTATGPCHQ